MPRTITINWHPEPPAPDPVAGQLFYALKRRATLLEHNAAAPVLVVKRTDHPHYTGDFYYAIHASDKHAWTDGETVLDADGIRDEWYAADCPALM